jgi:cytochrome c556
MLHSLSGIMHGLIAGDVEMGQQAARASGKVASLDSSLERKLPPDFRHLSMRTHKRFDALADAMKTGVARDAVLKQLAAVTASCVTCHDTYRLDEARE